MCDRMGASSSNVAGDVAATSSSGAPGAGALSAGALAGSASQAARLSGSAPSSTPANRSPAMVVSGTSEQLAVIVRYG